MIDKKQLIEDLLKCVNDATDTQTSMTGMTMCGILMNKVIDEALILSGVVSSSVDKSTLIEDLDDKRIIGTLVNKDGWYYCRKETAQYLLDKYEIKIK